MRSWVGSGEMETRPGGGEGQYLWYAGVLRYGSGHRFSGSLRLGAGYAGDMLRCSDNGPIRPRHSADRGHCEAGAHESREKEVCSSRAHRYTPMTSSRDDTRLMLEGEVMDLSGCGGQVEWNHLSNCYMFSVSSGKNIAKVTGLNIILVQEFMASTCLCIQ